MHRELTIRLNSLDLGQLLDGLETRAESWRKTAEFMDFGYVAEDSFVCEECTDAKEAALVAKHYERIIRTIEEQVSQQGGW